MNNFITILIILSCLLIATVWLFRKKSYPLLQPGNIAPHFKLQDEAGTWRTLEEFRGKKVVLYFYPKDDTPGCTAQACSLRDNNAVYAENNIVVLGVSYDTPESHRAFKANYNLPFILLSDAQHDVAKAYGAYQSLVNDMVPRRITILIDEQGKVIKTIENVTISSHAQDILNIFKEYKA